MKKMMKWMAGLLALVSVAGTMACGGSGGGDGENSSTESSSVETAASLFDIDVLEYTVDVGGYEDSAYVWESDDSKPTLNVTEKGIEALKAGAGSHTHLVVNTYANLPVNQMVTIVNGEYANWTDAEWDQLYLNVATLESLSFWSCSNQGTEAYIYFEYATPAASETGTTLEEWVDIGLKSDKTNYGMPQYAELWTAIDETGATVEMTRNEKYGWVSIPATETTKISFDGETIEKALDEEYTHVIFTVFCKGQSYAEIDGRVYTTGDAGVTLVKEITYLENNDGTYSLDIRVRGQEYSTSGNGVMYVSDIRFSDEVSKAIAKGFEDEGTDWASREYLAMFTGTHGLCYDATLDSVRTDRGNEGGKQYIYFNSDVIEAAMENFYMEITITATYGASKYDFWFSILNPNYRASYSCSSCSESWLGWMTPTHCPNCSAKSITSEGLDGSSSTLKRSAKTDSTYTTTFAIQDLYQESTGEYVLVFTVDGWWWGKALHITELIFS